MRTTEQSSNYEHLDKMTTLELLQAMNAEDSGVPAAVAKCIPEIEKLVDAIVERMKRGGRVFYNGAGTSGRLGVVDASEILPTYGVKDKFIGLIAGGDGAIRTAVEGAEDDAGQGWKDLLAYPRRYSCGHCLVWHDPLCDRLHRGSPQEWSSNGVHHLQRGISCCRSV